MIISSHVWNYLTIFFINIFVEFFLLLATSSDFTFLQNHKTIHTETTVTCWMKYKLHFDKETTNALNIVIFCGPSEFMNGHSELEICFILWFLVLMQFMLFMRFTGFIKKHNIYTFESMSCHFDTKHVIHVEGVIQYPFRPRNRDRVSSYNKRIMKELLLYSKHILTSSVWLVSMCTWL